MYGAGNGMPEDQQADASRRGTWWIVAGVSLLLLGLSAEWARRRGLPGFWTSYVVDFAGPAWTYIILRAQATAHRRSPLWRRFTPGPTAIVVVLACFFIEGMQYLELYDAHFDPWDLVAYASGVLVLYAIDRRGLRRP